MLDLNLPRQHAAKALTPSTFHRHNRQLRTLLLESQVWFCARDFSRLMGWPLNERTTRKLDVDQRRVVLLATHYGVEEELMVSESGGYELLVHHFHAENRGLRRWITNEVVPCLRDDREPMNDAAPSLSQLCRGCRCVCCIGRVSRGFGCGICRGCCRWGSCRRIRGGLEVGYRGGGLPCAGLGCLARRRWIIDQE
jgi:hypothetical protein